MHKKIAYALFYAHVQTSQNVNDCRNVWDSRQLQRWQKKNPQYVVVPLQSWYVSQREH